MRMKEIPMATYLFELKNCTSKNLAGIEGSLVNISNCKIYRTARGEYILYVESNAFPEGQIKAVLAPLKVTPVLVVEVPSTVLGKRC